MTSRHILATTSVCLALLVAVTGCSTNEPNTGTGGDQTAAAKPTVTQNNPQASPTPAASPSPIPEPSCELLIPQAVIDEFTANNWTFKQDEFRAGGIEIPGGIHCAWADFEAPPSDHLLLFGWAPVSAEVARDSQERLVSEGWLRESDGDSVYITEDPQFALAVDSEGYGLTYQFGDGWVKFADTKQGLLLVEWPPIDSDSP